MHSSSGDGKRIRAYGLTWKLETQAEVEAQCIRLGGRWTDAKGREHGEGLFAHIKNLQSNLWPDKVWHRWNELLLEEFIKNKITGVMGPANSGKTTEAGDFALTWYICFPNETTVMVSSTDAAGLERRIWGHIKKRWSEAKNAHHWVPGHIIESKQMILTDSLAKLARDFRNAMVGIPCVSNGTFVGLGKYVGCKNKHLFLLADECQFMPKTFVDAISNLNKNAGFRCIGMGNPKDPTDALGVICEPSAEDGGWEGMDRTEKTRCWNSRFPDGRVVNLVGTDSPNFDYPLDEPARYPFLITPRQIAQDMAFYGRDSLQFSMMNLGMMPLGGVARRVLSRMMCLKFGAQNDVTWGSGTIIKVGGLDAAYSSVGGDRTIFIELWFGKDKDGKLILFQNGPAVVIPVTIKDGLPQDQIALAVKEICEKRGIPPENFYYDGTGRSSLTSAFGRLWSPYVNSIEFLGPPSDRKVSHGQDMTCDDHFSKFVSELWFAARYVVEAGQFRGMTDEVIEEGSMREWKMVKGQKTARIEVEPKEITKLRMGRSPDIFDALVCGVEGARRKGFTIEKFATVAMTRSANEWLKSLRSDRSKFLGKHHLQLARN